MPKRIVSDRRRFPRVRADVVCRPAGLGVLHHRRNTRDISLGGMRVFSDDRHAVGSRLDLDVLLPDGTSVRCWGEVVWLTELARGGPAHFEVGMKFTDMGPAEIQRLAAVLVRDQGPT